MNFFPIVVVVLTLGSVIADYYVIYSDPPNLPGYSFGYLTLREIEVYRGTTRIYPLSYSYSSHFASIYPWSNAFDGQRNGPIGSSFATVDDSEPYLRLELGTQVFDTIEMYYASYYNWVQSSRLRLYDDLTSPHTLIWEGVLTETNQQKFTFTELYQPTDIPSAIPSVAPTSIPSSLPSAVPSGEPSACPSSSPSSSPTLPRCTYQDRNYCNNRGYCKEDGNHCECDDVLHYWPSELCAIYHDGRELAEGQYCYPNAVDFYCSWLGRCNAEGTACDCYDSEHRSSSDRCLSWTPEPPIVVGENDSCVPYDRSYCNNRGYCNAAGDGCECDDYLHFWPSEQCSTYHNGRELADGHCCYPNTVDYYCSWLGLCAANGSACVCYDVEHRLPSERCQVWHMNVESSNATSTECPQLPMEYTASPSLQPSLFPTMHPTFSQSPTKDPTHAPSNVPTCIPSLHPTYPPTLSPTPKPTALPTSAPSKRPSVAPTPAPTFFTTPWPSAMVCTPHDRLFCHNRGYCSVSGAGCVCDDVLHYWPSEQCEYFHEGHELTDGQHCYPSTVDYYCSWLGVCNAEGTSCDCFDDEHRSSADRCASYLPAAPTAAPSTSTCSPGDRGYCNNRGACADSGDVCDCDDPMHYWSSEQCSTKHYGGQLLHEDDCCIPGSIDYYCAWLGECQGDGMGCLCFEREHRLSSERCQYWHESIDGINDTVPGGGCPSLVSILSRDREESDSNSSSHDASLIHAWPYFVGGIVGLIVSMYAIIRWRSKVAHEDTSARHSGFMYDTSAAPGGEFEMASPMYASNPSTTSPNPPRRRSSLNPFVSDTYDEIDECEAVLPSETVINDSEDVHL